MAEIKFGFKAIKPLTAEHPVGSGTVVVYQPGDEVPANEWPGAAVEALIENEKLMRYATNVYAPGEVGGEALPSVAASPIVSEGFDVGEGFEVPPDGTEATLAGEPFPRPLGGGAYELSDGTHVKGKAKALAAQAALDVAAEG
jgi:hypothetical protein